MGCVLTRLRGLGRMEGGVGAGESVVGSFVGARSLRRTSASTTIEETHNRSGAAVSEVRQVLPCSRQGPVRKAQLGRSRGVNRSAHRALPIVRVGSRWGCVRGRPGVRPSDGGVLRVPGVARSRAGAPVNAESVVALVVVLALAGYLLWALLDPERF